MASAPSAAPLPRPDGSRRVLMAAGGTGGHIFPALALAEALRDLHPSIQIQFCCGSRPGEIDIYRKNGIEPWILPLSGRRSGLLNQIRFLREFLLAFVRVGPRIRAFRPHLTVGFGNYLSAPALLVSRFHGAHLALHEQNSLAGAANRWLSRLADLVLTATEGGASSFPAEKTRVVGNPVRAGLLEQINRGEARQRLGLPADGLLCLCFGGSLGALGVNRLVMDSMVVMDTMDAMDGKDSASASEAVDSSAHSEPDTPHEEPKNESGKSIDSAGQICQVEHEAGREWRFLWGTGPGQYESVRQWLESRPDLLPHITLLPYIERMDWAYAAADLVVSRAGALTLAELTALGKPSILIPLPHSAGDHQRGNAREAARSGGAIVIEEANPGGAALLASTLERLGKDPTLLEKMGEAARSLGRPDSARQMAAAILDILQPR